MIGMMFAISLGSVHVTIFTTLIAIALQVNTNGPQGSMPNLEIILRRSGSNPNSSDHHTINEDWQPSLEPNKLSFGGSLDVDAHPIREWTGAAATRCRCECLGSGGLFTEEFGASHHDLRQRRSAGINNDDAFRYLDLLCLLDCGL